jgi:parallel beta-helix repeat protein
MVGAKGERPVIDGRCKTGIVVDVRRSGVVLEHLAVRGAAEGFGAPSIAVNFAGVARGRANDLAVTETCGDADYGVNVFGSRRVTVSGSVARGYRDAGIYVGEISSTGGGVLAVRGNRTFANNRGIIIENISGGNVLVESNTVRRNTISGHGPPTGIFLHNSDDVQIFDNTVQANGDFGIHLDPDSDRNVLRSNVVSGNPTNLRDEGQGNCGSGNSFGDAGNVLPAC